MGFSVKLIKLTIIQGEAKWRHLHVFWLFCSNAPYMDARNTTYASININFQKPLAWSNARHTSSVRNSMTASVSRCGHNLTFIYTCIIYLLKSKSTTVISIMAAVVASIICHQKISFRMKSSVYMYNWDIRSVRILDALSEGFRSFHRCVIRPNPYTISSTTVYLPLY